MTRSAIAKRFNVPYQTVFKATSNQHAPKAWRERIAALNEATAAEREREVEPIAVEA
jgi:2-oxo-4-hydroxy-4-carboxy--5-ureidoimidazoline (OHCU) decarboxylase